MDVSAMITEIQEHGFEDISSTRIVAAINDAYQDVCARFAWPWLQTVQTATASVGNQTLTLATAVRNVDKVVNVTQDARLYFSDYTELINRADDIADTTDRANPSHYYLLDGALLLYPTPSVADTYRVYGYQDVSDLTSGTLSAAIAIPSKHHRVLITGAIMRLAPLNDDWGMAQFFEGQYERRIQTMVADSFNVAGDRSMVIEDTYGDD